MEQECGYCRAVNPPTEKFCTECGYNLADGPVNRISNANTPTTTVGNSTSHRITGLLKPGDLLDRRRYRITKMIGKGGFGAVYKATDERFQNWIVALKEMSDAHLSANEKAKALQDFENEANLLVKLNHSNLPKVSNFFKTYGKAYLVMEFIEGKTLEKFQEDRYDPLDEHQVMSWALQLCAVLDYLHTQSPPIIFRDMKPANVMITSKGEIKLIDFGIARFFKVAGKKDTQRLGSPGYAPPEQYRGQTDARSDIYALGATLYDLLTKEQPPDSPARQANPSLFSSPSQLNPKVSPAVEAIILKAMALKPEDRYQTATDMSQAIDMVVKPSSTSSSTSNTTAGAPLTSSTSSSTSNTTAGAPLTSSISSSTSNTTAGAPPPPPLVQLPWWQGLLSGVRNRKRLTLIAGLLILALFLGLVVFQFIWPLFYSDPIKAWTTSNGELIGLSDGRYAFDTGSDRVDVSLKKQAAEKLAAGDKAEAKSLLKQAAASDTSDAEALIYLENQRVLDSGSPYITFVVGTTMTGNEGDVSYGRGNLQGAYVAQKEYNDGLKLSGGRQIRLLIANAGSKSDYVVDVAEQIVQAAKQDKTIIGVMGWPYSAYAQAAIPVITGAHIPMVSSTASADSLSGISPYFFRVAPPNKSEAIAAARYAEQQLHASHVALFVDPKNTYSRSLADDFKQQFVAGGNQIIDTENYTIGDRAGLPTLLQKALNSNPDLIYFAGYSNDLAVLLVDLGTSQPNLQVLGGDALYVPNGYPTSARVGFNRLRFTSFAFFDEWGILGRDKPQFFSEYPNDFNPTGQEHANPYGFTRADKDVMLSYDAMYALFQGCQNALAAQKTLAPDTLKDGLAEITGPKAIQGISGQVSFGSNGDPMNKAVVVLYIDQTGHTQMLQPNGVLGCFVAGQCG
jgi:serine/threonine protein kinase/ABC-type branched-subunit amino acid transport system substrate-binding protein